MCCLLFKYTNHKERNLTLEPLRCAFVGYSPTHKGYRCIHPITNKFYVTVDVIFVEHEIFFQKPYFQGETALEDKKDSFLDLSHLPITMTHREPLENKFDSLVLQSENSQKKPEIHPIQDSLYLGVFKKEKLGLLSETCSRI